MDKVLLFIISCTYIALQLITYLANRGKYIAKSIALLVII